MDRKLFGLFSGTHLTILAGLAIIVPGALYGAVTYQPVSIVDPNTGSKAFVTAGRALYVLDPIAAYRNSPANIVDIYVSNGGTRCETTYSYSVPTGKALVLTAISGYESQYSNSAYAGYFVYASSDCSGNAVTSNTSSVSSAAQFAPVAVDLGAGIVFPAGSSVSVYSSYNFGFTNLHGYLVPAAAVPPAQMASNGKPITAADVAAKMAGQRR